MLDGHPHTLSLPGGDPRQPIACLGVNDFGQSGDVDDLYRHFGIDAETIVGAALDLEWKVIAVFGDQDMSEQGRAGNPLPIGRSGAGA